MANFKQVNKAVNKAFPDLDIEVVRGDGYVYFSGADAFDKIDSIYSHPVSTSTDDMIRMCVDNVRYCIDQAND